MMKSRFILMNANLARAIILTPILLFCSCGGGGGSGNSIGSVRARRNHSPGSAGQSSNWSGYGIAGAPGGFTSVRGTWVVPAIAPSSHDTASSTWAGVGGGCANPPSCTVVDQTLIQAGTEADNTGGKQQYSAWWEALPAPSVTLMGGPLSQGTYDVRPGDSITVTISSNLIVWTIEIQNVRAGVPHWTFTQMVPYASAGLTAEWIEEAPLTAGTNGAGQIALSNFSRVEFDQLLANGANPALTPGDAIVLVNGNGKVIARPSAPGSSGNSFAVCFGSGACN